ncbi:MAG: oligosaccharide flippase family protein [Deltaproteobacteria bacterium]|nr:oligosaccharide flippase family protein [Deltaproteobacteria bacterium]
MTQLQSFIVAALLVRAQGTTAYAIWMLSLQLLSYLSFVDLRGGTNLRVALGTHQHSDDTAFKRRQIGAALLTALTTAPLLLLLGAFLVIFATRVTEIPSDQTFLLQSTLAILIFSVAIDKISTIPGTTLRAVNEEYRLVRVNAASNTLVLGLAVLSILCGFGVLGLAVATLLGGLAVGIIKLIVARRRLEWLAIERPSRQEVRHFLTGSWWLSLISLGNSVLMATPLLFVSNFYGITATATYAAILAVVRLPISIFWKILDSADAGIAGLIGEGDRARLRNVHRQINATTSALMALSGIIILPSCGVILSMWLGQPLDAATDLVVVIFLALSAYTLSRTDLLILTNNGGQRTVALSLLTAGIVSVTSASTIFRSCGLIGIAAGFLFGTTTLLVLVWGRSVTDSRLDRAMSLLVAILPVWGCGLLTFSLGKLTALGPALPHTLIPANAWSLPLMGLLWFCLVSRSTRTEIRERLGRLYAAILR